MRYDSQQDLIKSCFSKLIWSLTLRIYDCSNIVSIARLTRRSIAGTPMWTTTTRTRPLKTGLSHTQETLSALAWNRQSHFWAGSPMYIYCTVVYEVKTQSYARSAEGLVAKMKWSSSWLRRQRYNLICSIFESSLLGWTECHACFDCPLSRCYSQIHCRNSRPQLATCYWKTPELIRDIYSIDL